LIGLSTLNHKPSTNSRHRRDKEIAGRRLQTPLPPLIKMDEQVEEKINALFGGKP
jgi:hypothetical protein